VIVSGTPALAQLPPGDVQALLRRTGTPAQTEHTIAEPGLFADVLDRVRVQGLCDGRRLRTPAELAELFDRHGLRNQDICGFKPKDPRSLIKVTLARRRGQITDEEIPPIVGFILAPHGGPVVTYLGYARKVREPGA
jgi:hypothetical protein